MFSHLVQHPAFKRVIERYQREYPTFLHNGRRRAPQLADQFMETAIYMPDLPLPSNGINDTFWSFERLERFKPIDDLFSRIPGLKGAWDLYITGESRSGVPPIRDLEAHFAAKRAPLQAAGQRARLPSYTQGSRGLSKRRSEFLSVIQCIEAYRDATVLAACPDVEYSSPARATAAEAALQTLFRHAEGEGITYSLLYSALSAARGEV